MKEMAGEALAIKMAAAVQYMGLAVVQAISVAASNEASVITLMEVGLSLVGGLIGSVLFTRTAAGINKTRTDHIWSVGGGGVVAGLIGPMVVNWAATNHGWIADGPVEHVLSGLAAGALWLPLYGLTVAVLLAARSDPEGAAQMWGRAWRKFRGKSGSDS